jgi:hypothetical protein
MKVSFDYDGTLTDYDTMNLAKKFVDEGNEVWITTARPESKEGFANWNNGLMFIAKKLGIPPERVVFSEPLEKWEHLRGFDIHFDNEPMEVIAGTIQSTGCVFGLINRKI